MRISILLLILVLITCKVPKQATISQTLEFNSNFGGFTLNTPTGWTKIKVQGIDSYVGQIAVDAKDTIEFDLGYYSNDLTETEVEDIYGHIDRKLAKNKVSYDIIANYKTKIVTPKRYGVGMSGVYIDSLWKQGQDKIKFNLYGNNLTRWLRYTIHHRPVLPRLAGYPQWQPLLPSSRLCLPAFLLTNLSGSK